MKLKNLFFSLSILFSLNYLSSCNLLVIKESKTVDDIVFNNQTFSYDGNPHSIFLNNIPDGWKVTYTGNEKTYPGTYYVIAKITDLEGETYTKIAQIIIEKSESILTADLYQEVYAIPGVGASPTYTLSNTSQSVSVDKYYRPGTYYVDLYAESDAYYNESNHLNIVFVVKEGNPLGVTFMSKEVIANGEEQSIVAEDIPVGYKAIYRNNKGIDKGKYNASCDIIDSGNNVVMTLNATLTINNAKNLDFENYLNQFFVEYLGNDYVAWNIFTVNPENYGFVRDYTDIASWYSYKPIEEGYLEEAYQSMLESKKYLTQYNINDLSYEQEVSYYAIYDMIEEYIEKYNPENNFHPLMENIYINKFGGYPANISTYVESYQFRKEQDLIDCLTMIESVPTSFSSYLVYAQDKLDAGYPLSDYTINTMNNYLLDVYEQGSDYYLSNYLINKINQCYYLTSEQIANYSQRALNAVNECFIPAHKTLAEGLKTFIGTCPKEKEAYLISYGEVGKEYYLYKLSSLFGISDFDPEDYNQYINSALTKYKSDYLNVVEKVNNLPIATLKEFLVYESGKSVVGITDPYEMLEYLKEFAKTIVPDLESNPQIIVKYMDDSVAKVSNAIAYYMKSPLDSNNVEHITLNGNSLSSKYNEALFTLAHEGYPGHLYAFNYTKSLEISNIAKIMTSTAHGEGWATYVEYKLAEYIKQNNNTSLESEQEALELYLDMTVASDFLNYMLYTTSDFLIHYNQWTINEFANYLFQQGFKVSIAAKLYKTLIEIPTDYAAYGYGRSYFKDIHDYAKNELGNLYNEIEFNSLIQSKGWCSYDILDEMIDGYIEETKFIYGVN